MGWHRVSEERIPFFRAVVPATGRGACGPGVCLVRHQSPIFSSLPSGLLWVSHFRVDGKTGKLSIQDGCDVGRYGRLEIKQGIG